MWYFRKVRHARQFVSLKLAITGCIQGDIIKAEWQHKRSFTPATESGRATVANGQVSRKATTLGQPLTAQFFNRTTAVAKLLSQSDAQEQDVCIC